MHITTIADLRPDRKNRRKHNPRNVGMIVDALHEVGAARSGVIDEHNTILAGNATWEALAEAGIERVRVVETDGTEWVVVKRTGLSDEQKRRLALLDNRSAELASWDTEQIAADLAEGLSFEGVFSEAELAAIMEGAGEEALENVNFKEYDENVANEVEYVTCPQCGHKWPK